MATFKSVMTETRVYDILDLVFSSLFIVDMVIHFKVSEATKNEAAKKKIKKPLLRRVVDYFKDRFVIDFVSLVPFPYLLRPYFELSRLLYLLKVVRLIQGFQLLDYTTFTRQLK